MDTDANASNAILASEDPKFTAICCNDVGIAVGPFAKPSRILMVSPRSNPGNTYSKRGSKCMRGCKCRLADACIAAPCINIVTSDGMGTRPLSSTNMTG